MILSSSVIGLNYNNKCIKCGRVINQINSSNFFLGKFETAQNICKKCLKRVKNDRTYSLV